MRGLGIGSVIVQLRQAEVSQPGVHLAVQENVAGLDVAVDDHLLPAFVQIQKTRGYAFDDLEPPVPVEVRRGPVVQELVKAAVGHEIVDQEELASAAAVAQELDDVPVPQLAYAQYFSYELLCPLSRFVGDSFSPLFRCWKPTGPLGRLCRSLQPRVAPSL
ncbi:L-type lectin-domain containing receptor kinase IV.2-like [Iris pallida]|uniref:L-type lectin-domain containing receptor kinase IV.2-like n=1 Tax=Iris pallida TaxID=29817 RepID=A0AAX6GWP5_IRIPA|nr:L-type lectin-domain containing receptor kinase IV.2-like [Iris pallida]